MANGKTGDDGAAIDPRYDPAFQRGFEGDVATGPRGQSTLRRTAAVNPAPARVPAQPTEPAQHLERVDPFEPATADAPEPLPTLASTPETSGAASTDAAPAPAASATPRELMRNPFVIALAALAALLILVGSIWAYEGFATIVRNGGTRNEIEFWAAQTMSFGAPLTIVVGVAIAAVLLVLFGRSWQAGGR